MGDKKNKKTLNIVLDVIFFGIIGVMIFAFTWNLIDIKSGYKYPFFGVRQSVIVSESMASINESNDYITSEMKQIQKYDVVTTKRYQSFDDIEIYDIATYYTGSKNLICHRVVNKYESEGKQYVVFRGDANNIDDEPVTYELIRGKVVNVVPKVGHVVAFVQSPYVFIAIFGTLFFVFLGAFIINYKKDKKEAVINEEAPSNEANVEAINNEEITNDNHINNMEEELPNNKQ